MYIPFNKPLIIGKEIDYINQVFKARKFSGDGCFSKKCEELMEKKFKAKMVLLTSSCTQALEMSALLLNIGLNDEVILPSFTFPSTANAICLKGAKPVFVDIRKDTLNINEDLIEAKITLKTKAIFVVHYAGIGCNMEKINQIAKKYNLFIIEDAAHAIGSKYKDKYLGTIGTLGTYSFHESKNLNCGEGGAIVINDKKYFERAEIIREKGTNRKKFLKGEVDKYTWIDIGSSCLMSEILAAFLYKQLLSIEKINQKRIKIFNTYYKQLKPLEENERVRLPIIPFNCMSNGHLFYILVNDEKTRNGLIKYLKSKKIGSTFHYIPLHSSPMGISLGARGERMPITESVSKRLLRLPLYYDLTDGAQSIVIKEIFNFFKKY